MKDMTLIPREFYLDNFFDDFDRKAKVVDMKCDIYEKDGNYNIEMDIPGFERKDIKIECEKGVLVVSAEKNSDDKDEDKNYIRRERVYSKMSRSFNLGDINEEDISASLNDGTLKIVIPKTEKQETKKVIEIK